jgi:hypothetical protein
MIIIISGNKNININNNNSNSNNKRDIEASNRLKIFSKKIN